MLLAFKLAKDGTAIDGNTLGAASGKKYNQVRLDLDKVHGLLKCR